VLPHPDDPTGFTELRAGRASELGKTVSNTFTLNRWHKEMVLRGVLIRKSLLQRAAIALKELAKPSSTLWDICAEAEQVAGSKEPAAIGTGFHKITELYDQGKIGMDEAPEPWDRDLLAYAELLSRVDLVAVPEFTERIVWNRPLNTAGRFDRLWEYQRCCALWHVGDLKTGRYLDAGWHEIPIQLDCYAGATHMFHPPTDTPRPDPGDFFPNSVTLDRTRYLAGDPYWTEMPPTCRRTGLVLHVPSDGKKDENKEPTGDRMAALYEVKLDSRVPVAPSYNDWGDGWTVSPAELAKAVQAWQKTKHIAKLVDRVEVTTDGEVIDSPLTLTEQIDLTETRTELEQLWDAAKARQEWKGHHTRRARERLETLAS
jgi:hypothetical protein